MHHGLLWQKFEFYEGSCGIPLIVSAPGMLEPGVCRGPISQIGLLATLAELCNVPVTTQVDEPSFAAQLRNPAQPRKAPVFSEYALGTRNAKYMIRDGDYKYTFWTHDIAELYNLRDDPDELNNLALDRAGQPVAERLKQELFRWHRPRELERN